MQLKKNSAALSSLSNNLFNQRYLILKFLGEGVFGKTFLAVDKKHKQSNAIEDALSKGSVQTELYVIKECHQIKNM